jgi:hypothetical protein
MLWASSSCVYVRAQTHIGNVQSKVLTCTSSSSYSQRTDVCMYVLMYVCTYIHTYHGENISTLSEYMVAKLRENVWYTESESHRFVLVRFRRFLTGGKQGRHPTTSTSFHSYTYTHTMYTYIYTQV